MFLGPSACPGKSVQTNRLATAACRSMAASSPSKTSRAQLNLGSKMKGVPVEYINSDGEGQGQRGVPITRAFLYPVANFGTGSFGAHVDKKCSV
jgi:hypothetical protein